MALAILAQQMMNESRVDVFSVVRKLRSQRQALFRNFVSVSAYTFTDKGTIHNMHYLQFLQQQYEFIYRGLYTYSELHVANGNAGH